MTNREKVLLDTIKARDLRILSLKQELKIRKRLTTEDDEVKFAQFQFEINQLEKLHALTLHDNQRLMSEISYLQHITKHLVS